MTDLLLDVGSTNVKWAAGGDQFTAPFPPPIRSDFPFFEVSAKEIFGLVARVMERTAPSRVFLSVQMHGYVLLKGGIEQTEYISWRDTRGGNEKPRFAISDEYGVSVKPNLPRLSVQTQTCAFDEFCTLGSYLVYKLTGVNRSHVTDVAPSGFYNVRKGEADGCGFRLPLVSASVERAGFFGKSEIFTPVGDMQAAVLGAARGFDGYVLNLGTAGQLCCVEEGFVAGDFESRPYFGGRTLCTVTGLPAGAVVSREGDAAEELLVREYAAAMKRLPRRSKISVTGGVVKYRRPLLERVLKRLNTEYVFHEGCDALEGLEILAKGEII